MAVAMIVSSSAISASASAKNREFSFGINTFGNSTTSRELKEDKTSAWIQAADGHFYVTVYGSTSTSGTLVDKTYNGYVTVSDTKEHYLPNTVKEGGFKYCALGLRASEVIDDGWASGYWSPDSVK